jgi:hypothetical protein
MNIAKFEALVKPLDKKGQAEAAETFADSNSLWVKFIFTDDAPNANKQAIAQAEYPNIIRSGPNKPFKKAGGVEVSEGHDAIIPIGTIVEMEQENNLIVGLAAVWEPEFPAEAAAIRKSHEDGNPLHVSWELFYKNSELDEDGVEWLQGVSTRAVALVSQPAYDGRTPVMAVANKQKEGDKSMELEQALERVKQLEGEKTSLEESLADAKASLDELVELKNEVETLREFKTSVEEERARAALVDKRMKQFSEAGIEMSNEEFEAAADKWLSMDDDAFEFVLSQLVASKPDSQGGEGRASVDGRPENDKDEDPAAIVRQLLEERKNPPQKDEK